MNYVQTETPTPPNWQASLLFAILLHLLLIGGLYYLNSENPSTIKAYGIWGLKKFMGKEYEGVHRTTFIIDEDGKIAKVFAKVKTKTHAEQILASFKSE